MQILNSMPSQHYPARGHPLIFSLRSVKYTPIIMSTELFRARCSLLCVLLDGTHCFMGL